MSDNFDIPTVKALAKGSVCNHRPYVLLGLLIVKNRDLIATGHDDVSIAVAIEVRRI